MLGHFGIVPIAHAPKLTLEMKIRMVVLFRRFISFTKMGIQDFHFASKLTLEIGSSIIFE